MGEREDIIAGGGEGKIGDVEADDEIGKIDDPRGFDFPAVVALHGFDDCVEGGFDGSGGC